MRCPFCMKNDSNVTSLSVIKQWDKKIENHLIITLDNEEHVHVHGPMENKEILMGFIKIICKEGNIELEDFVNVRLFDTGIGGDYDLSFRENI